MIAGGAAAARGRRMAEALIERTARLIAEKGLPPYSETSIEVIGADDSYGPARKEDSAREVPVKIGLRHPDARALDIFAREFAAPGVSTAQGITGAFAGRPKPAPVLRVHSFLWPKSKTPVRLHFEGREIEIDVPVSPAPAPIAEVPVPRPDIARPGDPAVTLRALAVGRSGDKGDDANIGLITPPMGVNVFIVSSTADVPARAIFRGIWPFVLTELAILGLLIAVPGFSLWLPELAGF